MKLGELEIEEAAKKAAGNWQDFTLLRLVSRRRTQRRRSVGRDLHPSSGHRLAQPKQRQLSSQKPSNLLPRAMILMSSSSRTVIGLLVTSTVSPFGSSRMDKVTEAFERYHELAERMDEYPILDEVDYSEREYEATLENIEDAAWRLKNEFDLPESWEGEVYDWLSNNESSEIENTDDQGGYPSEEALRRAFDSLGYSPVA